MLPPLRRWAFYTIFAAVVLLAVLQVAELLTRPEPHHHARRTPNQKQMRIHQLQHPGFFGRKFRWRDLRQQYPVSDLTPLPSGPLASIPQIQYDFEAETDDRREQRQARLAAVKEAFLHSWDGYKTNAWLQDEVAPVSGIPQGNFGGWGATLVDSLDTLWIMGLEEEFTIAVAEVEKIDFSQTAFDELNVFETTIRYLGGLMSAYDLSGHAYPVLFGKAVELGEMLYHALDTPNRMPCTRWKWKEAMVGERQEAARYSLVAEVGSLTLEFTRLSQLTGNPKWYDAADRIMRVFGEQQSQTKIPGLWPVQVDTQHADFTDDTSFTIGGMADSIYEYLPKQHLMLGGRGKHYRHMYVSALEAMKEHIFFRPLNPQNKALLFPGTLNRRSPSHSRLVPEVQHLACFAGGMVALAAKTFNQPRDLKVARQLVDGCLWAYESTPSGIMPEIFKVAACEAESEESECTWSESRWYNAVTSPNPPKWHPDDTPQIVLRNARTIINSTRLPSGFTKISDPRYQLRPEAIESVFVLYRITGDLYFQEKAWDIFQAITAVTRTDIAYAGVKDVRRLEPELLDTMESFWTAETLKYFYLVFSEPNVVSLDDFVFNTEAHPFLRPKS
ncbi:hypothetical protein B0A50_03163 [Salinomyces thailandicus]|uniref:alpha-1,2-Mannosidase n=1 Tax=Salinomyces thailandicus TaxID=706561 RepID=A0A4V5N4Z4_9PEZI|nr:hypothetical protein B0A50_03163 [Salinomyces thailandica]